MERPRLILIIYLECSTGKTGWLTGSSDGLCVGADGINSIRNEDYIMFPCKFHSQELYPQSQNADGDGREERMSRIMTGPCRVWEQGYGMGHLEASVLG